MENSSHEATANIDQLADDFREKIDASETLDAATDVGNSINESKGLLGTALHTELKNKATRRYHFIKHRNGVEAAINSIPPAGEPEATELFLKADRALNAARRHVGDDLYDKFRITLDDMKPEYVS